MVVLKAVGLGEARQVEPVLCPALAVGRRSQQPIDHALVRVWFVVGEKLIHFVGRRRQTGEVERDAADQTLCDRPPATGRVRLAQCRENKFVDRISRPARVADVRHTVAMPAVETPSARDRST